MKMILRLAFCLILAALCFACTPKNTQPEVQQELSLKRSGLDVGYNPATVGFVGEGAALLMGSDDRVTLADFRAPNGFNISKPNTAYAFSEKTGSLVLGQRGGRLLVYDVKNGQQREVSVGHGTPEKIIYSPNGRHIALVDHMDTYLVDIASGEFVQDFRGSGGLFQQMTFSSDGRYFAVNCLPSDVKRQTGPAHDITIHQGSNGLYYSTITPRHRGRQDREVWIYDVANFKTVGKIAIKGTVNQIRFSPDDRRILVSTTDPGGIAYETHVRMYDMATQKEMFDWGSDMDGISEAVFSSDGAKVVLGTANGALVQHGVVRLLDAQSGEEIERFTTDDKVLDVDITPDGKFVSVVSGTYSMWGKNASLTVYDTEKKRVVYQWSPGEFFRSGTISGSGRYLVTGGGEAKLQVFEFPQD